MLGAYIIGCAAWGAAKATALGAHSTGPFGSGMPELLEEVQYRWFGERVAAPAVGLGTEHARIAQALFFGAAHPGHELDAALGGYVYSRAYEAHGFKGAVLAHIFHNLGVWLASK